MTPTDAEIIALMGDPRYSTIEAVRQAIAKWGTPTLVATKISIPTETMEQEFQNHYRRGYEAGKKASAPTPAGEPVAWYEYNADLDAWFMAYSHNPKAKTRPLVFGDTSPQPVREPLSDDTAPAQPAFHPATVDACIARLEQGGQSAAVSILRHHFEQKGG